MEEQKGSYQTGGQTQDQKTGKEKVSRDTDSLSNQQGIVTHSNPKSRDDNRESKGPAADRQQLPD